jgi:hypothetical protein
VDVRPAVQLEETTIPAICRGVIGDVHLARLPVRILFGVLPAKRAVQVGVPLLFLLASSEVPESINIAVDMFQVLWKTVFGKRHFYDELRMIKEDRSNWLDQVLLRELDIAVPDLLDGSRYQILFERISNGPVDGKAKQYVDRTLRAIEGEKQRRSAAFRDERRLR